ncbi:hypothetical protein STEG23_017448, partial [Scotinomys teguina]
GARTGQQSVPLGEERIWYISKNPQATHLLVDPENENLWIASRLICFDQPRPPDRSSDVSTFRSASRHLAQKMKPHSLLQSRLDHHPK